MKGHIRERSPGRWAIVLDQRDPETGKRKRRWHSFNGNKREAQSECARLIAELKAGVYLEPSKTTVAAFLERWLDHMKAHLEPRSHERYTELARKNLIPLIGSIPLTKLRPAAISNAYVKALESGRRLGRQAEGSEERTEHGKGLSPSTVRYMHRILRQALQQAMRWQLLVRNPADAVRPPKLERREMKVLDANGMAQLIETARETNLFVPILLAVMCGPRRGEITALRWRSVDIERGQISIVASTEQTRTSVREKAPKSERGRRTIALPLIVVDELRQHRLRQAESLLKLGARLNDDHHVVMRADGKPLQPRSLTHAFRIFLDKHDLPRIRLHDLRHSHATQLLASGVHPKIAQERLGHSSVAITLDLYSHVLPGMQADAADRVDLALREAINRRANAKG
jgi:integrase